MNPDLLKPELQALVNDVNINKKALEWTLWIRQVLFLKEAWYLLLEMEPEEEFREVCWQSMSKLRDNLGNTYHLGIERYHRNMRLIKITPPIHPEAGRIFISLSDPHLQDIRYYMKQEMWTLLIEKLWKEKIPEEAWRDEFLRKIDEFDLKYDIPEDPGKMMYFIKDIENDTKSYHKPEQVKMFNRLKNLLLRKWNFQINMTKMNREKYEIKSAKVNRGIKFKDIEMKLTGVIFYPEAFSVTMTVPARSPTLEYSYRKPDDEMLSPLHGNFPGFTKWMLMELGIVQNLCITLYFKHKLTGNEADIDNIAERIVIKDLCDDPNVAFCRAPWGV